jgi:tripartite-type tricarboxylate transporter receptor subunit TctC
LRIISVDLPGDHLFEGAISIGYRPGVQGARLARPPLLTTMPHSLVPARRALLAALVGSPLLARAQAGKSIRLIVPFTPGGSTDILARAIAPRLAQALGQSVVVDNKPGAGGSLGAAEAAKAEPDGSTLLMGHIGTLAVNPSMYPKLAYDPVKSFVPVAYVARVPNVLVVNASSPIRTLKDLVAAAQAKPGQLTYSSGGNGSAAQITFESLKLRTKVFMLHIPYRGTAPSVTDVIAGQVDCTFTGAPAVISHVKSGRLRALAVSSPQRLAALPDVPTVAESGYPGFEADQWYGLVAPAGTPAAVVSKINAEVNKALALPEVAQQLAAEGATPMPSTPQAFGDLIKREIPRWAEVVKAGNVKPD